MLNEMENLTGEAQEQVVAVKQGPGLASGVARSTLAVLVQLLTTMIVLFFLLASGDRLLRGFIEVLPKFSDKRPRKAATSRKKASFAR